MLWFVAAALAGEPIWLDAGPAASAVMEGFDAVDLDGSARPDVRWHVTPFGGIAGAWPDPLVGDALRGGVLELDLAPGRWRVWVQAGRVPQRDLDVATSPWSVDVDGVTVVAQAPAASWEAHLAGRAPRVFRPGESIWERGVATTWPWLDGTFEVTTSPVRLKVDGRPLSGLILAPEDTPMAAELAASNLARRNFFHRHHVEEPEEPATPPLAPVAAGSWTDDPADAVPLDRPLAMELAIDERRGGILWLGGGGGPVDVQLRGDPDLAIELYEVVWLDRTTRARGAERRPRPEMLAPLQDGQLRGGQGRPPGLAYALRGLAPGTHRASLLLTRDGERQRVRLTVRVADQVLPPTPATLGFAWQPDPVATALLEETELHALIDAQFVRMRTLGATSLLARGTLGRAWVTDPVGASALARHVFQRWHELGGTSVVWVDFGAITKPLRRRDAPLTGPAIDAMARLTALAAEAPLPVILKAWEEEGFRDAAAPAQAAEVMAVLRDMPGDLPFFAAMGHAVARQAVPLFDIVGWPAAPVLTAEDVAGHQRDGAVTWLRGGMTNRSWPWLAWAIGARGMAAWHWNAEIQDPVLEAGPAVMTRYSLIGPGGAIWHTLGAERLADGQEDTRLLALHEACGGDLSWVRTALDGAVTVGDELLTPASMQDIIADVRAALRTCR